MLGVSPTLVASLALAGSFIGPLLGVIAVVHVMWPEEDVDPWFVIQKKVYREISAKFDEKRRKKLGDRMRRYIKQFSRCSQAWIASSMVKLNGVSVPRWIVEEAEQAKTDMHAKRKNFFQLNDTQTHTSPSPRCLSQIETSMSLERDEWYTIEEGGMSALFMPFANMHTQVLNALADNPHDSEMQW